ncbi:hypothetical protein M885DRAFT_550207 [Pelagophyceae sp. CCMP2097]|nr:hypothetical protein M885DRAFT_550207 [Pelagophyceae sp. CCMP2097]
MARIASLVLVCRACVASLAVPAPLAARVGRGGALAASAAAAAGGADFSSAASTLFANDRVPAALFAGASAGAVFAMPLGAGDGLRLGLAKRGYTLCMVASLAAQLVVVLVSTLAMGSIATRGHAPAESLAGFVDAHYALEWAAARLAFLFGILSFTTAVGLRAWVTIGCPIIAKAAVGIIASSALLALAFIQEHNDYGSLAGLPARFAGLLLAKTTGSPLFALAGGALVSTAAYLAYELPHVCRWLVSGQ